jgi:hypothetical protein
MSTVPFHEMQEAYGISESCKYNEHYPQCQSPRCGCSCHKSHRQHSPDNSNSNSNPRGADSVSNVGSSLQPLDKYCPKCKERKGSDENFCRKDGTRLSSLRCPECGTPGDAEDNYCGYCGCSMKLEDRQLEMAATGVEMVETVANVEAAEAAMKAAMAAAVKTVKTVPAPPKISIGMFK